jgi:rSAM-associated Gly-rich repeat protein
MKINTTAGLVGFLLALSSVVPVNSDATAINPDNDKPQSNIESRLSKISNSIKQKQAKVFEGDQANEQEILVAYSFLNRTPNFYNNIHGWPNGGAHGWINGGGFRNGGFANSGFRNGGGFVNHGGGGGFVNHHGGGGFVNHGGGGSFRNYR